MSIIQVDLEHDLRELRSQVEALEKAVQVLTDTINAMTFAAQAQRNVKSGGKR